jgi:hypothetical protein
VLGTQKAPDQRMATRTEIPSDGRQVNGVQVALWGDFGP